MQNLMIGASGSGKGYEGCVYQILPALQSGRKVITNMPLDLEKWRAIDPAFVDLIEIRKRPQPIRGTWEPTREEGAFNLFPDGSVIQPDVKARPFAGVWDYYSEWRHPQTGMGPLFVVDEAQYVIPQRATSVEVEEWSALHRHFNSDILWMTQSYGKLSNSVRDNVQMVYRLRKKTAWGQPNSYIRKVQDGIRGEVMNTTERNYQSRYFGLWKSHTQGSAAAEFKGEDIKSFYSHWTFRGAAILMTLGLGVMIYLALKSDPSPAPPPQAKPVTAVHSPVPEQQLVSDVEQQIADKLQDNPRSHPWEGYGLHLAAVVRGKREGADIVKGLIRITQNGQPITTLPLDDLQRAGYKLDFKSDCVLSLRYGELDVGYALCDAPKVGPGIAALKSG